MRSAWRRAIILLAVLGELETPYTRGVTARVTCDALQVRHFDMAGVGHFTAMEAPTAFNHAVIAFLLGAASASDGRGSPFGGAPTAATEA